MRDAARDGIPTTKLDPFGRAARGLKTEGVLDTTSGYVLASKACSRGLVCKRSLDNAESSHNWLRELIR